MRMNPMMFQMSVHSSPTEPNACAIIVPACAIMPTKMMSEEPLPMPYSVMRSPSHMTIVLPAISMMMTLAMVR